MGISYDQERQSQWLQRLLGQITPLRLAVLFLVPMLVLLVLFGYLTLRGSPETMTQKAKLYHLLKRRLERLGIQAAEGETVTHICQKAAQIIPQKKYQLQAIQHQLNKYLYSTPNDVSGEEYKECRSLIYSVRSAR